MADFEDRKKVSIFLFALSLEGMKVVHTEVLDPRPFKIRLEGKESS